MISNLEEAMTKSAEYTKIDWIKTGDNLRTLLFAIAEDNQKRYVKGIANALHVDERDVHYWLSGTDAQHRPSVETLYLLSKYLGIPMEDIIAIRAEECGATAEEILHALRHYANESCNPEISLYVDFARRILLNEAFMRDCPITTLSDFLLYLPLIPEESLHHLIGRIQGDVFGERAFYVLGQLKRCYDEIDNPAAKQYADSKRERLSKRPNCYDWNTKTKNESSIEKQEKHLCGELREAAEAAKFLLGDTADMDLAAPFLAYMKAVDNYASRRQLTDDSAAKVEVIF